MDFKFTQSRKHHISIVLRFFGNLIEVKPLHSLNADRPIDVTPSGIDIAVKLEQLENANSLIVVIPSEKIIEVKLVQLEKVDSKYIQNVLDNM